MSGDDRELYYWENDQLVAVRLARGLAGALVGRDRTPLLPAAYRGVITAMYDASADGECFVVAAVTAGPRLPGLSRGPSRVTRVRGRSSSVALRWEHPSIRTGPATSATSATTATFERARGAPMHLRDIQSADDRVEATNDPAVLLALAQEIRSRFADEPGAEAIVRRALVKWIRVRRELGSEPATVPIAPPLAATLLEELRDANSVEQLLDITARIRQYHARGASGGQEPSRRGREEEGPMRGSTLPLPHGRVPSSTG